MREHGNLVNAICSKTGLSIRDLATFIGADQSLLTKYANRTHSIPVPAMLELALLHQKVFELPPIPAEGEKAMDTTFAQLQSDADWLLTRCYQLQKKLDKMRDKELEGKQMLVLVAALEKDKGQFSETKKSWLACRQYDAEKKLSSNCWLSQQKLMI